MIYGGQNRRQQHVKIWFDNIRNSVVVTTWMDGAEPNAMSITTENAKKLHQVLATILPVDPTAVGSLPADVRVKITERVVETVEVEKPKKQAKVITTPPKAGSNRYKVLSRLKKKASTDEELVQFLGMPIDSVRPRRGELVKGGFVRDSGKRRGKSIVWEVVKNV